MRAFLRQSSKNLLIFFAKHDSSSQKVSQKFAILIGLAESHPDLHDGPGDLTEFALNGYIIPRSSGQASKGIGAYISWEVPAPAWERYKNFLAKHG